MSKPYRLPPFTPPLPSLLNALGLGALTGLLRAPGKVAAVFIALLPALAVGSTATGLSSGPSAGQDSEPPVIAHYSRPAPRTVASTGALRWYLKVKDEIYGTQASQRKQRFCFVQQRVGSAPEVTPSVWMIWVDGQEIANIGQRKFSASPSVEEAMFDGEGLVQTKSIRLATDVVDTADEIAGSTFLVDRAWVNTLTDQCRRKGLTRIVYPIR